MKVICQNCGTTANAKTHTPGSIWIEIVLWLCWLVPGLIYSIWRHTKKAPACAHCKSTSIVPADSPMGRKLASELSSGAAPSV